MHSFILHRKVKNIFVTSSGFDVVVASPRKTWYRHKMAPEKWQERSREVGRELKLCVRNM